MTETVSTEIETSVLSNAAPKKQMMRASTNYYAGYQIRLNGEIDTQGELAGLSFTLYERPKGSESEWTKSVTKNSENSPSYQNSYVYFKYFRFSGDPTYEYKVSLNENSSYMMDDMEVKLSTDWKAQLGLDEQAGVLNLKKKEVPKDSTDINVDLANGEWGGTGTSDDPVALKATVDRFKTDITVKTANEEAVISYNGTGYKGSLKVSLPYGESQHEFSVTSSDQTKTSYYKITVTREKYTPLAPSDLKAVSPSEMDGEDGKIEGLVSAKLYEYRSAEEQTAGTGYTKVQSGATEITGLKPGKYYVRLQETEDKYASPDRIVEIKQPVTHKVTLPKENIPEGVKVRECPTTMIEGREIQIQLELPKNRLLDKVGYKMQTGGISSSSYFNKSNYQYTQEENATIVTIRNASLNKDITLNITLLEGEYYQIISKNEDDSASAGTKASVSFSKDGINQGRSTYYKSGDITATVAISDDWKAYAEIKGLKAYQKGTEREIEGTLANTDKNRWTFKWTLSEEVDIRYSVETYPADVTALEEIKEQIGDLEQYVDNDDKKTLESRLTLYDAYKKQPAKNQGDVDNYVNLLKESYSKLTPRQNLSADTEVLVKVDSQHIYDGKPWKPIITIMYQEEQLTEDNDYKILLPEDMTSPGEKEIVIEFIGKYCGSKKISVKVIQYSGGGGINGLHRGSDGKFYYYKNGVIDREFEGIVKYDGGEFFVRKGTVAVDINGLCLWEGTWYFFAQGQIQRYYTGLAFYDGEWFYLEKGVLDAKRSGIVPYDGSLFIVVEGRIAREANGLWQDPADGTWYFAALGQVQTQHTGVAAYDGAWFYIRKGLLATDFYGMLEYNGMNFKVVAGQLYRQK